MQPANIAKLLPAMLFACVLWVLSRRSTNALALPTAFGCAIGLFYVAAWTLGMSVEQLQADGWLFQPPSQNELWPPFTGDPFDQIDWGVIWLQAPKIATMAGITAASLLLASTGIELAVRRDIDLDQELRAAGLANFFAGLGGGVAGFQTLSLSVLSYKMNAPYRLVGIVVAFMCAIALFFGAPLLAYLPVPLFGSLLLWIGISLLYDWLIEAYFKIRRREYVIIVLIVVIIGTVGFLEGVLVGLVSAILLFVLDYSRVEIIKYALTGESFHSSVERSEEERQHLVSRGNQILVLRLQGFVFFGTAHRLQKFVRTRMLDGDKPSLKYLFLDYRNVTGLDSSAILSLTKIRQLAETTDASLILTNVPDNIRRLLVEGFSSSGDDATVKVFDDLDHGMEWCEERVLDEIRDGDNGPLSEPIERQLVRILRDEQAAQRMLPYLEKIELSAGDHLIHQGDHSSDLYFVEAGQISIQLETPEGTHIRLRTMGAGTIVGEISFYLDHRRSASVVTDSPTTVWRLSRASLSKMQVEAPEIASSFHEHLVRVLAERLSHTNDLVRSLAD